MMHKLLCFLFLAVSPTSYIFFVVFRMLNSLLLIRVFQVFVFAFNMSHVLEGMGTTVGYKGHGCGHIRYNIA